MTDTLATSAVQVPPRIAEYVRGYFPALKNLRLASRFRLSDEQLETFALVLRSVFYKEIKVEDFPAQIRDRVKLESGQAFYLAAEAGDQHFTAFEDYLGPVKDLVQQWRSWGREFGGRLPGAKGTPDVEQVIARAGDVRSAPTLEMNKNAVATTAVPERQLAKTMRPSQTRQPARVMPSRTDDQEPLPVPQTAPVQPERAHEPAPVSKPQPPGMSREQFLDQVRGFTIDKLRSNGEPAVGRLQQVYQSLGRVVSNNPADHEAVAQAVRQSPLFRLYQEMGQESLRTSQSIDHVIYGRYQANQPYLLREEFDAVGQLAAIATLTTN